MNQTVLMFIIMTLGQVSSMLPATGESNNLILMVVGVLVVIAAIFLFISGRKKK